MVLLGSVIGMVLGMWLGVNIGRENPLLANPFDKDSLQQKIKQVSGETLERGGKALEYTGQALQDKMSK